MIIVTGGAGFIGSNLVKALNQRGYDDITVVDNLRNGHKFQNLVDCHITDYLDKSEFLLLVQQHRFLASKIRAVFHLGACSTTTEWDGRYMLENNFTYSKTLLNYCMSINTPFIYASSASVYGDGNIFQVIPEYEKPLNVYGYSKLLFDQYVRQRLQHCTSQVAGFRYFNVYGPREQHKGTMASVAYHFHNQMQQHGVVKLFAGCDGYADGEQRRDFIYVADAVAVNLWFLDHPQHSGIFNVGTGKSQSFNDVANAVLQWHGGQGQIEYIPFPEHLQGHYQSFTEADMQPLWQLGYDTPFHTVEQGVPAYLDWLQTQQTI